MCKISEILQKLSYNPCENGSGFFFFFFFFFTILSRYSTKNSCLTPGKIKDSFSGRLNSFLAQNTQIEPQVDA